MVNVWLTIFYFILASLNSLHDLALYFISFFYLPGGKLIKMCAVVRVSMVVHIGQNTQGNAL